MNTEFSSSFTVLIRGGFTILSSYVLQVSINKLNCEKLSFVHLVKGKQREANSIQNLQNLQENLYEKQVLSY